MANFSDQPATGLFQNYESDFQLAYDELTQKLEEIPTLPSGIVPFAELIGLIDFANTSFRPKD